MFWKKKKVPLHQRGARIDCEAIVRHVETGICEGLKKLWPNVFYQEFTQPRREIVELFMSCLCRKDYQPAWHRRGQGSTSIALGLMAWAIKEGLVQWPVYICDSQDYARMNRETFDLMVTEARIDVPIASFYGIRSNFRGLQHPDLKGGRPDLVILDCVLDVVDLKSATAQSEISRIIDKDVLRLGGPGQPLAVLHIRV